jgi:hypothetical protein
MRVDLLLAGYAIGVGNFGRWLVHQQRTGKL